MKIVLSFLIFSSIFALPKSVDFIFMSAKKSKSTLKLIKESKKYAQAEKCIKMGDGCFHPQLGFVEENPGAKVIPEGDQSSVLDKDKTLKTINSAESDMVDCKEEKFFDIFCGKAGKRKRGPVDLEVWIDTSSSMRNVDFSLEKDECFRKSFVERLKMSCAIDVATFDTSIKSLGGLKNLCLNYGLNDQDRLIDWIKRSEAKKLIILTDIDEASMKLKDFLFRIGANIKGADLGDFDGDMLLKYTSKISKNCKK